MKILYGVQGTGNGHITRSIKMITTLKSMGFEVDTLVSGSNYQINLPFECKFNFKGFNFSFNKDGSINKFNTLIENDFYQFLKDTKLDLKQYDTLITDFEPILAWSAKFKEREIWGIGNQYSFLSKNSPRPTKKDLIGETVLKWMAPVTNPIGIHFQRYDDFIELPIIRDDIIYGKLEDFGHYTVYLPNVNLKELVNELNSFTKNRFHIFSNTYYYNTEYRNCRIYPLDKFMFQKSFLTSTGVITTGGFQTTSESLYCGKKLLVIPINNQYEQMCNGESLSRLGIKVGQLSDIGNFLTSCKNVKLTWEDPTNKIISMITKS